MSEEFGEARSALVTGGARRIGAALTRSLARDGWHVAIHCNRSRDEADALRMAILEEGGSAAVVHGDLADSAVPARLIEEANSSGPPVRLLVNNASLFEYDALGDFDPRGWARHMDVNLRAPALLIQAFAHSLSSAGERLNGLVVNMLDNKLFSLNPDFLTYTISKYGLLGLTELSARALAPDIRVCGIAPAVTMVSGPQSRENFEHVHGMNPLGRGVDVEDIVRALRFIIDTPTLNAETIRIDGGQKLLGLPRDVAFMAED